jgi:hypothetical protein
MLVMLPLYNMGKIYQFNLTMFEISTWPFMFVFFPVIKTCSSDLFDMHLLVYIVQKFVKAIYMEYRYDADLI